MRGSEPLFQNKTKLSDRTMSLGQPLEINRGIQMRGAIAKLGNGPPIHPDS